MRAVVAEVARLVERFDLATEVQKVLSGLEFEVHMNVKMKDRAGETT